VSKAQSRKASSPEPEPAAEDTEPAGPIAAGPAPDLVPHLWRFRTIHRDSRDADRMLRAALKLGLEVFGAPEGCLAAIRPGIGTTRVVFSVPEGGWWDRDLLAGFLRGARVRVPPDLMLARIRRQGRMWGALAIRAPGTTFHWDARQALSAIGTLANELIDHIDRERVREVRARIDRKVLEQSQPKHLFYELLHGIRSLTAYDHSAALLTYDLERQVLEVVAEQVAWQKAKGKNVGRILPECGPLRSLLDKGVVCGFDRVGGHWADWTDTAATALADLLDFDGSSSPEPGLSTPPEGAILCAPLVTRGGLLGVLKVASIAPGSFTRYEVELVAQFLPQAAVALQHSRRAESLERKVLLAERKHAMADLARGVSHDVNNALGVVLPLVQQLRDELDAGGLDPAVAADDLREVERAIQACRRIFGGMLSFARGLSRNPSEVSLSQAVDAALAILRQGLERRGVVLTVDVPADLPYLLGVQADVEQLLLNLLSNARDATRPGDALTVRAVRAGDLLELIVEDTGCGIPREHLARIQEPFFTTKPDGHGLGLAICRSIVAGMRGRLQIESTYGAGTRVRAALPIDTREVAP
jgi:signal transduction histidine kinase